MNDDSKITVRTILYLFTKSKNFKKATEDDKVPSAGKHTYIINKTEKEYDSKGEITIKIENIQDIALNEHVYKNKLSDPKKATKREKDVFGKIQRGIYVLALAIVKDNDSPRWIKIDPKTLSFKAPIVNDSLSSQNTTNSNDTSSSPTASETSSSSDQNDDNSSDTANSSPESETISSPESRTDSPQNENIEKFEKLLKIMVGKINSIKADREKETALDDFQKFLDSYTVINDYENVEYRHTSALRELFTEGFYEKLADLVFRYGLRRKDGSILVEMEEHIDEFKHLVNDETVKNREEHIDMMYSGDNNRVKEMLRFYMNIHEALEKLKQYDDYFSSKKKKRAPRLIHYRTKKQEKIDSPVIVKKNNFRELNNSIVNLKSSLNILKMRLKGFNFTDEMMTYHPTP